MFLDEKSVFFAPMSSNAVASQKAISVDRATVSMVLKVLLARGTSSEGVHKSLPLHGLTNRGTGVSEIEIVKAREVDVPLMLAEIKRMTGLDWEAIGSLLNDVSRQTIYNWKQGLNVKPENSAAVAALHGAISFINRGDQVSTMAALNEVRGGVTAFDLLKAGKYREAKTLVRRGSGNPRANWSKLPVDELPGRDEHWTERLLPEGETRALDDHDGFLPNKLIKRSKVKVR